jgi:hypothetical protein
MSITACAAGALAGCGGKHRTQGGVTDLVADRDVRLLNGLLELERRAIAAYTAVIPLLAGPEKRAATLFLRQELGHAGMLLALIGHSGGGAAPRAASYPLGRPRGRDGILKLLHDFERAEVAGYLDAIQQLSPGHLRSSAASILADDAQHVSVLRSALGLSATPGAFVTGAE